MKRFFIIIPVLFILLPLYSQASDNNSFKKSLKEYTIGVLLSGRGECDKAIPHFEKALSYNKDIYIYFELADCYKSLSEMEKTIEYLELATKEFPDNPEGYLKLGDYYSELISVLKSEEIVKKALENYRKAFDLSHNYDIYYKIIENEFILQDYDSVIKDFESLPESYRSDYYTLFYVSVAYNIKQQRFKLFQTLKKLTKLNIPNPKILNELISISGDNNFYLFAYKFTLKFKQVYRDFNDWDKLLLYALLSKKFDKVIDMFNKYLKENPTPVAIYCFATANAYTGNYPVAVQYYKELLKNKKVNLSTELKQDIYLDYIRVLIATKHYKEAYNETLKYEKIYGLSPDTILKQRFESLLLLGDKKKAAKTLYILKMVAKNREEVKKIENTFKSNPDLIKYDYLAALYYTLGNLKESVKYYLKCIKLSRGKKEYLASLALCYHRMGKVKKALKLYKRLYSRYPEDPLVLNNYAYFLLEYKIDIKKALELAKKAVEIKSDVASYRDTLGFAYLLNGDINKAESHLLYAYRQSPMNPDICLHLGDFYYKKGDVDRAKEYWQDAIDFGIEHVKEVEKRLNLIASD